MLHLYPAGYLFDVNFALAYTFPSLSEMKPPPMVKVEPREKVFPMCKRVAVVDFPSVTEPSSMSGEDRMVLNEQWVGIAT